MTNGGGKHSGQDQTENKKRTNSERKAEAVNQTEKGTASQPLTTEKRSR